MTTKVIDNLKTLSTKRLLELWDETERRHEAEGMTIELADVRGWIMDALNAKNPTAFDAWMEDYDSEPYKHFLS